jgi:hypothetical protein
LILLGDVDSYTWDRGIFSLSRERARDGREGMGYVGKTNPDPHACAEEIDDVNFLI